MNFFLVDSHIVLFCRFNVYPVGAFGVYFNPSRDGGQEDALAIAQNLRFSRYIDLQTKVINHFQNVFFL